MTKTLSGEQCSTLSWYFPLLFGLQDTSKSARSDINVLSAIKKKFTEQLHEQFELNTLHMDSPMVLSTALDPRFRKLSFLMVFQQAELMETSVTAAESIRCNTAGCTDTTEFTDDAADTVEPPSKKRSVLDQLLCDEKQEDELSIEDEVKSYIPSRAPYQMEAQG